MFKYTLSGNTINAIIVAIVNFFWNEMNFIDRIRCLREILQGPGLAFTKDLVDAATAVRNRHTTASPTVQTLLNMRENYSIEGSKLWWSITDTIELLNPGTTKIWEEESPIHREFCQDKTLRRNYKKNNEPV